MHIIYNQYTKKKFKNFFEFGKWVNYIVHKFWFQPVSPEFEKARGDRVR